MAVWPAELPQDPDASTYAEAPQSQVIRSQMDAGPAKQRRRFSAATRSVTIRYLMSLAQTRIFEEWFEHELSGGALAFDWPPGRQLAAVGARIVGDPPYQLTPAGSGLWWYVTLQLEVLP